MTTDSFEPRFTFKRFAIDDRRCGMKTGTDGVLLGSWAGRDTYMPMKVLDAGTGSGLIALMIAQRMDGAEVTGVEIDRAAALDAAKNFAMSPWADRLKAETGDVTASTVADGGPYGLIVSNPPYYRRDVVPDSRQRADARHITSLSYDSLIELASRTLAPDGIVAIVAPAAEEAAIVYSAELRRLKLHRLCRVVTVEGKAPARILAEFGRDDRDSEVTELVIRDAAGEYTPEYRALTSRFYLNF